VLAVLGTERTRSSRARTSCETDSMKLTSTPSSGSRCPRMPV